MLKKEGKINDAIIKNLLSWQNLGFHVYLGPKIWPDDHVVLERLARYTIRACFSSRTYGIITLENISIGKERIFSIKTLNVNRRL